VDEPREFLKKKFGRAGVFLTHEEVVTASENCFVGGDHLSTGNSAAANDLVG